MRNQRWWLRGRKLVQRSANNRLIPRGDEANAPPFLPLDPVIESKAVHNMGGYQVDEGRDDWFLGGDGYQNTTAIAPSERPRDDWDWGSDDGGHIDTMPEIEATAQTSHLDPGGPPAADAFDAFLDAGHDDPLIDLTDASTGPVQPNAPNPEAPYQDDWDFFDETIALHVVPMGYMQSDPVIAADQPQDAEVLADDADPDDWWHALDAQQDPNELAEGDDWYDWHESAVDSIHDILDEDDDAVGPDQPPMPVDDGWPWQIQDDVGEPFDLQEPAGITLPALPYSDDFPADELGDDLLLAEDAPQRADAPPADGWLWLDDTDDTLIDDQAPQAVVLADPPADDGWVWDADLPPDAVPIGYAQSDAPLVQDGAIEDGWLWDAELPPDVVPDGFAQADLPATLPRQEGDAVLWDWNEDVGQLLVPTGYTQADVAPPGPPLPYGDWHWDSDAVEDEWREFIEPIGRDNSTGADTSVAGDPNQQALLRRRDDFLYAPPRDEDWNWNPTEVDDAWWPEISLPPTDFAPVQALAYPDAWDWDNETTEPWLSEEFAQAKAPIDPAVAGEQEHQALLRRRDDFETDPPRDQDWDWYATEAEEHLPLESGPVVDAQVLFLEVPVDDAADHFPPQPDNDWAEPSEPVGADAPAALPRVSEEHDWKHFEDGEGDYEIEPSQPVDAPLLATPDEWNWNEEATEDTAWQDGTADFKPNDFVPIPGPTATDPPWHFEADETDDTWWHHLPQPDTDGTAGPDLCPILLAEAYARIAELEALLAECRAHGHGDGGGGGASGDGDDVDHGHHHGHRDHDGEQRHLLEMQERDERERRERAAQEKRARIERDNAFILGLAAATVRRRKRKKEDPK